MTTYDKHYKKSQYFGEPYPELLSFFQKLEPKGHILDLGCGQGRDTIPLARMGYTVTGVDVSKLGVSQMRARRLKQGALAIGLETKYVIQNPLIVSQVIKNIVRRECNASVCDCYDEGP